MTAQQHVALLLLVMAATASCRTLDRAPPHSSEPQLDPDAMRQLLRAPPPHLDQPDGDISMLACGALKTSYKPNATTARGDTLSGEVVDRVMLSPRMATMQPFVVAKGYPLEEHEVTTKDDYISTLFRIPYGYDSGAFPEGSRPPVLLLHGISLSSVCWVVNEADESLGFVLADRGYDVWMFNTRGNTFSRGHKHYGTSDVRYWSFAMDEMALIDLPAAILYIQQVTGHGKVALVGHSQGGSLSLMMLSRLPHFNHRVSVNIGLAPVTYVHDIASPNMILFCKMGNLSSMLSLAFSAPSEHIPMSKPLHDLFLNGMCQNKLFTPICVDVTISLFGKSAHITGDQYKKYWRSWPSATSYWNAMHWSQMYNEPQPRIFEYNYGAEYHLTKVTAPCVLLTGGTDVLAPPKAMDLTRQQLRQSGALVDSLHTPDYGHMDYIWDAAGAKSAVYPFVIKTLHRYTHVHH